MLNVSDTILLPPLSSEKCICVRGPERGHSNRIPTVHVFRGRDCKHLRRLLMKIYTHEQVFRGLKRKQLLQIILKVHVVHGRGREHKHTVITSKSLRYEFQASPSVIYCSVCKYIHTHRRVASQVTRSLVFWQLSSKRLPFNYYLNEACQIPSNAAATSHWNDVMNCTALLCGGVYSAFVGIYRTGFWWFLITIHTVLKPQYWFCVCSILYSRRSAKHDLSQ